MICVAAALTSATAYGCGSAVQHAESARVQRRAPLDPGLLTTLARRSLWWWGTAADLLAVLLQAVALHAGPVALVQTLLVGGLPVAVLISCALAGRLPHRREVGGVLLCTAGLAALAPAGATAARAATGGSVVWTSAGLLTAVLPCVLSTGLLVVGLLLLARRWPATAGAATGAAAGVAAGAGSVLLAVSAQRIGEPARLLLSPIPYATLAVGGLALLLAQAAFQTGALGTPLAVLTLLEPVVAVVLALVVLHERLTGSAATLAVGGLGAGCACAGVLVLSRTSSGSLRDRPRGADLGCT